MRNESWDLLYILAVVVCLIKYSSLLWQYFYRVFFWFLIINEMCLTVQCFHCFIQISKNSYHQAVLKVPSSMSTFYNFFSNINTANHENWSSRNPFCALCTIILNILRRLCVSEHICKRVWWWVSVSVTLCLCAVSVVVYGWQSFSVSLYRLKMFYYIKNKTRC